VYRYRVYITRVVDGDTVDVDVDLGFSTVLKKQRVRMMAIDTPESRTRDLEEKFYGKQSKYFLEGLLKDQKIQLVSHDKGKFGRILGELFIDGLETSVNQTMINNNHAVPYYGGNKEETERHHLENRKALNEQGIVYDPK
jgi:micrococcal nuclease|tara:strand:+ start:410 stop:829 length:420 start_codon:yes stop_codon:yes gene_type:complete